MNEPKWHFSVDPDNEWKGINDDGIETFSQRPVVSMGKEMAQNSLDVRADVTKPIRLIFKTKTVKATEIPGLQSLKDKINGCIGDPKNAADTRTVTVLNNALNSISGETIVVLLVEEQNTLGMPGPHNDPDSQWYAYTSSRGTSSKASTDSLGSFGIGKMAPIANSLSRSLLISTMYEGKNNEKLVLAGGMSFQTTHRNAENEYVKGTGKWIMESSPIEDIDILPKWMQRQSLGTTFAILGFNTTKDKWDSVLAASLVSNFFSAIHSGDLEVEIHSSKNKRHLNSDTLEAIFADCSSGEISNAIRLAGREELIDETKLAYNFYKCMVSGDLHSTEVRQLGNINVRIMVEEGLPNRVGFIRDGMFITTGFDSKIPSLTIFRGCKDFVAVVESDTSRGNAILRELEPPQHDRFVDSRMPDGKLILKALGTRVKGQLDKVIKHDVDESAGLDFTADLFGDEYDEADGEGKTNTEIDPEGKVKWQAKPIKVRAPRLSSPIIDEQGEQGGTGGTTGKGKTDGTGGDKGTGAEGDGDEEGATGGAGTRPSETPVPVSGFRVLYQDDDENRAKVYLSLPYAGEFVCKFYVAGQDSDELLQVTNASYGDLFNNGVKVRVGNMERLSIDLTFNDARGSALMVTAYAY